MSMSFRHRIGLVLAGMVIGAPLLGVGVANAATATVTFSGTPLLGLGTLACPSSPSQSSLTVTAGSTVDFVNRTGRTATLWAGDSQKSLPDKSLVPVTFTQSASVVIQMLPDCALDLGSHTKMTVLVQPASGQARATTPATAPASGDPRNGATASPTKSPKPGRTAGQAIAPTSDPTAPTSVPSAPATAGIDNNDPFATAAVAPNAAQPVVGEPVGPAAPRSASGLLTLIATVGVVGVSAAAIRAIIAQRASRVLMA
jgi:hypothetical protein